MFLSRLLAVAAAFALSPTASFAMPIQCSQVCPETYECDMACGEGYRLTTCQAAGYACYSPASAPESSGEALVSACSDCSDARTNCLWNAATGGSADVQSCVDAYVACAASSCGSAD
ncbi:hypothetical protein D7X99_09455 [Corallococcus sp. AB032C]|nr:hypothetical protein D7X99_09455 [Corallococcus sp. AB032C]